MTDEMTEDEKHAGRGDYRLFKDFVPNPILTDPIYCYTTTIFTQTAVAPCNFATS